ncbi:MAG: hypothetical protein MRQ07_01245 [Candidatus Midichloria sp.]|nr:hypothetical protein [Candidatus Midichloria sp.]
MKRQILLTIITYEVNTWNVIKEGIGGGLAMGFLREIAFDPSKGSTLQVFTFRFDC